MITLSLDQRLEKDNGRLPSIEIFSQRLRWKENARKWRPGRKSWLCFCFVNESDVTGVGPVRDISFCILRPGDVKTRDWRIIPINLSGNYISSKILSQKSIVSSDRCGGRRRRRDPLQPLLSSQLRGDIVRYCPPVYQSVSSPPLLFNNLTERWKLSELFVKSKLWNEIFSSIYYPWNHWGLKCFMLNLSCYFESRAWCLSHK